MHSTVTKREDAGANRESCTVRRTPSTQPCHRPSTIACTAARAACHACELSRHGNRSEASFPARSTRISTYSPRGTLAHTSSHSSPAKDEDNQRGFGGAGGFGGGRRGGRVGFGTGGAGVVLRRSQPSKSWRDPRFLTD